MKRFLELSLNLLCLVLVGLGVFAYLRERRPSAAPTQQQGWSGIRTGQKLAIPNVTWRHRSLVLALSTKCHFCEQGAPFYQKLLAEQKKGGWQSVLLFPQLTEEAVSYAAQHNYYSPTILHANFTTLGVNGTPTLVLVDENGIVLDEWIGLLSPKEEADVATHLGIDPRLVSHATESQRIKSSPGVSAQAISQPNVSAEDGASSAEVLADELVTIIAQRQQVTVLDVRDRNEFNESHLSGAVNVPVDELHVRASHELSKKIPIILYCNFAPWCQAKGIRTLCSAAEEELSDEGFSQVRYIRDRLPLLDQERFAITHGAASHVSSR